MPDNKTRDYVLSHHGALGSADFIDIKALLGRPTLEHVTTHLERTTARKLAQYCFSPHVAPHLGELGQLLWSWGL